MFLQALLQAFLVVLHALDGFILGCGCRPDALHYKGCDCGLHLYQNTGAAAWGHTRSVVGACAAWGVCFVLRSQNHINTDLVDNGTLRGRKHPRTRSALNTSR